MVGPVGLGAAAAAKPPPSARCGDGKLVPDDLGDKPMQADAAAAVEAGDQAGAAQRPDRVFPASHIPGCPGEITGEWPGLQVGSRQQQVEVDVVWVEVGENGNPGVIQSGGHYEDEYIKTREGWR